MAKQGRDVCWKWVGEVGLCVWGGGVACGQEGVNRGAGWAGKGGVGGDRREGGVEGGRM